MLESANPRYRALETESEPRVRERSVLSELEIPIGGIERESLVFDARHETVVIVFALRSADDLAITLGREAVVAQHGSRIGGVLLHIGCLCLFRIIHHEDGT